MTCRDVQVKAPDSVSLRGWFYVPEHPTGSAILLLHGVGASRTDMVGLGYLFLKAGYSVLEPDLRGHGMSGGIATYGVAERQDVHEWVSWLLAQPGVGRVYGFGASLGGTVLLESLSLETRFRGVIAESAYSDFPVIADERMRRAMPEGLKWVAGPLVHAGILWAKTRYAVDLSDSSAIEPLRRTHVPVFLIHGIDDHLTSSENSERLQLANPQVATLWLVPKGGHADIWRTAGGEFEDRVLAWLASH